MHGEYKVPGGKLVVDGVQGPRTNAGIEKWGGRPMNGYLDAADKRALQARVGTAQDGVIGPLTTKALQRKVGADVDGKWAADDLPPADLAEQQRALSAPPTR